MYDKTHYNEKKLKKTKKQTNKKFISQSEAT